MRLLNPLRIARGHVEQQIDARGALPTRLAGEVDAEGAAGGTCRCCAGYGGAGAAGSERQQDVVLGGEGFDLPGEYVLVAVVIGGGGEHGGVGGEGHGRKARTVGAELDDEFGGEVLSVGGAAAV